ncbi:MAG TPA: hypothetical protein PK544_14575 [Spirochaetota bacterium]|nr:hypothetical protein [Spirochaetota bacterium]
MIVMNMEGNVIKKESITLGMTVSIKRDGSRVLVLRQAGIFM